MGMGRLAVRVVIGGLFIGHGTQKLRGWFGGSGIEGTEKMMEALEMEPARRNAVLAGATEAVGGAMLAAGLATPLAAAGLISVMTTAIRKVHWKNGLWNSGGGWEFNATMIAALAALAETGPGTASVDALFGRAHGGRGRAFCVLALGAAASAAAIEMGRRGAKAKALMAAHDASDDAADTAS